MVGKTPIIGRSFLPEDDRLEAPRVAILAHTLWTSRYGADPKVVGRTIKVNDIPTIIIGIMPQRFNFPFATEIWIPAARPDVVHQDNVARLKAKLIPQGANIPFTPEAERILHEKGTLIVPDFIANAGGVICASVEYHGGTQHQAFQTIEEKIRTNTRLVLEEAAKANTLPRQAAVALAEHRVRKAMEYQRGFSRS
jgi:glutamate dehydrogenase/leucine dehydrogenase